MPGLLVVRASDGAAFNLWRSDLEFITTLEDLRNKLLSPLLSIPPECLICMNEEGGQLREESVQHLAILAGDKPDSITFSSIRGNTVIRSSSPAEILRYGKDGLPLNNVAGGGGGKKGEIEKERRLYIYDRDHLDADPENVADSLAITEDQLLTEPELQSQDPLPSHVALSHHNLEALRALIHSISLQRASLQLAISNLSRVLASNSASFNIFQESTTPNIIAWESLLNGWQSSMDAIAKVPVVNGLLTRSNTSSSLRDGDGNPTTTTGGVGGSRKCLGDYVNSEKMSKVKDGCASILADLKGRSDELKEILDTVLDGTTTLEAEFNDTSRELEDLEACEHDANVSHVRIEELVHAAQDFSQDSQHRAECFDELLGLDAESRDRIRFLVERKNAMTRYLILTMQRISVLQSEISIMPVNLVSLDEDTRTKTDNFKHLARLEGLIPAYVATLVEIVRRRTFSSHLLSHAIAVGESLSHLSLTERARRDDYRGKFSGKLPWEVRGLGLITQDQVVPRLVLEGGGNLGVEDLPELGRETLDEMKATFEELLHGVSSNLSGNSPIINAIEMLKELMGVIDNLDLDFKEVALGQAPSDVTRARFDERVAILEDQLRLNEESNLDLERQLQTERSTREEELAQLYLRNSELSAAMDNDQETLKEVKRSLVDLENELGRIKIEKTNWEKERSVWERERKETKRALEVEFARRNEVEAELIESNLKVDEVVLKLNAAEVGTEEFSRQLDESENRHEALQSDHSNLLLELQVSESTIINLEDRLKNVEATSRSLNGQVMEKDRILRDLRNESELEKAVLEKEVADLHQAHNGKDSDVRNASARNSTLEEIAEGLREQVTRWEKVSAKTSGELELVKKDLEVAQSELRSGKESNGEELIRTEAIARKALKLAGDLRDENNKITAVLMTPTTSKSGSSSDNQNDQVVDANPSSFSLVSTSPETPIVAPASTSNPVVTEIDYTNGNLEELLVEVQNYDRESLTAAVRSKVESLTVITKKWSKEAKLYRERARVATSAASEKIAFRNFAKGDLALFLPTRNSAVPVWAGFNVSFPHHFLSATGTIAEQMRTREWIVARITTITERVVDVRDPSTNPYLLPPGTRYFLLEVESWNKDASRSRRHSSRGETRRSSSTGQLPPLVSSSTTPPNQMTSTLVDSATLTTPSLRRSVSENLPANATEFAKSEFAIIEEETHSGPPSPNSLQQSVPRSNEPFGTPPAPSALALSLARSAPTDPFASGPFASSTLPILETIETSPFATQNKGVGIDPAFLPSKKSSNGGSISGLAGMTSPAPIPAPRYIRPSSRVSSTSGQGGELAVSPASTQGSHAGISKSPGSVSASSILSSRPIPGGFPRSFSGNDKGFTTLEAQEGSSRWNSLTEDLAKASKDESRRGKVMTIGRNSKGWPISRGTVPSEMEGSVSWGASSIIAALKGGSGVTPSSSK